MQLMHNVVLLIAESEVIEDGNYLRFGNELFRRHYQVKLCFLESLAMHRSEVIAEGFDLTSTLKAGDRFPGVSTVELEHADLAWVLTLGKRMSFLDKLQLLYCLQSKCKVINSVDSLMHFKSKYFQAGQSETFQYPATYASSNPDQLFNIIASQGGKWIVKPPAGSLGREIFLLTKDDANVRVILETMTGVEADQYCLFQPYIEEIQQGEKRVLIAAGKPVGQYLRHAKKDHRTNMMHGAEIEACELSSEETTYCEKIGEFLYRHGAEFVGLDLAYPYVIEFNVINPGGLLTIESLNGTDLTSNIIDKIFPESEHRP